jgi:uncharacterized peroxidase-related enzyme
MAGLDPLSEQHLAPFEPMFGLIKQVMGFVPNSTKTMARNPALLQAFSQLGLEVMTKGSLPADLKYLVSHLSSRAAGCQYCQAHTIGLAERNGCSEEKLQAVWEFDQSDLFTDKEKAALRFGLASGAVPNLVTADHFNDLQQHFTDDEILELGAIVSFYGFLNRWNDTFGTSLEEEAINHGKHFLSDKGWNGGKHI